MCSSDLGHSYQPTFWYFPAYTFHVPLFFFVSGYLAKSPDTLRERLGIIAAKTKSQLVPYFGYNLFFSALTYVTCRWIVMLPWESPDFSSMQAFLGSAWHFFCRPLIDGHQYYLFSPAWFLITLYIVNVIFQIISFSGSRAVQWTLYTGCIALMLLALEANKA